MAVTNQRTVTIKMTRGQALRLNNPIPLHFYSPEERMPADDSKVVLIYIKTGDTPTYYYTVMALYKSYGENHPRFYTNYIETNWIDLIDDRIKIIAWASFSPEWVLGVDL